MTRYIHTLTYNTNISKILIEHGDFQVVLHLTKSEVIPPAEGQGQHPGSRTQVHKSEDAGSTCF